MMNALCPHPKRLAFQALAVLMLLLGTGCDVAIMRGHAERTMSGGLDARVERVIVHLTEGRLIVQTGADARYSCMLTVDAPSADEAVSTADSVLRVKSAADGRLAVITVLESLEEIRGIHADLVLTLPPHCEVLVDSLEAEIEARGVRSLHVRGGARRVRAERIAGDVDVAQKKGVFEASGCEGAVRCVYEQEGRVTLRDLSGRAEVTMSSGRLVAERCRGKLVAEAKKGTFLLNRVSGATLKLASGKVEAKEMGGRFQADLESADLRLEDGGLTEIEVDARRGDLYCRAAESALRKVEMKTRSGDLEFVLGSGCQAAYVDADGRRLELDGQKQSDASQRLGDRSSPLQVELDAPRGTLKVRGTL